MARRRRATRSSSKAGLPPGTLVYTGERERDKTQISIIDYDAETLQELPASTLSACLQRRDTQQVTWVNVDGLHEVDLIERVGVGFGMHPLALEDVLSTQQRPKLEDYEDRLFLVLHMLSWDATGDAIQSEQIALLLGPRFLLTFQEKGGDVFDGVRERLRSNRGRIRKAGPDYLLYALLDAIVDNYFTILEHLDDRITALEEEVSEQARPSTLHAIHAMRREMIFLRRAVWPLRDVIAGLERGGCPLVDEGTRVFLRDVRDHTIQVAESIETLRDLLTGMQDVYLSTINNRLNGVMKVLTIITTIFIPLSFIAGVYGMNFQHMPELHWRFAYPAVLVGMLAIALAMLWLFRKRDWL